jgi:threonine/homoserine/homoserine lactone efflux protein
MAANPATVVILKSLESPALDLQFLLSGAVIGFSIAAPVGPIGVLCIRTTLEQGRLAGFVAGLGAASADAVCGCVAVLGLTVVTQVLQSNWLWLRLGGGLLLCYMGMRALLCTSAPATSQAVGPVRGIWRGYGVTFALTLTNPMTIIAYGAIVAGAGALHAQGQAAQPIVLIAGVFLGSALWWLLLSGITGLLRGRMSPRTFLWVNRAAGAVILGFGILMLLPAVRGIGA